jgi:hypothetical protein
VVSDKHVICKRRKATSGRQGVCLSVACIAANSPIAVEAGEAFTISERNDVWENNPAWIWVWCADQQQRSGWLPKNIIQMNTDSLTGTTRPSSRIRTKMGHLLAAFLYSTMIPSLDCSFRCSQNGAQSLYTFIYLDSYITVVVCFVYNDNLRCICRTNAQTYSGLAS